MKESVLKAKSFAFAISSIHLYKFLTNEKREYDLARQILRSGTSIGANIREAEHAQSKKDFINKMSISQKETNETLYWIELLRETCIISHNQYHEIYPNAIELMRMLTSTIKTAKKNLNNNSN